MKKLISIVLIVVTLFMLTSCYDPRYVANENWEDIQGTLVEKYQESDKGNVYNFFRIDINGEILLKKAPDEVYYAYSETIFVKTAYICLPGIKPGRHSFVHYSYRYIPSPPDRSDLLRSIIKYQYVRSGYFSTTAL